MLETNFMQSIGISWFRRRLLVEIYGYLYQEFSAQFEQKTQAGNTHKLLLTRDFRNKWIRIPAIYFSHDFEYQHFPPIKE